MSDSPHKAVYEAAADQLERELASNEALGGRAVALLGFCGVILALAATLADNGLPDSLGTVGRPVALVSLIGAFLAVFAAAGLAVLILRPKKRGRVNPDVLRQLRESASTETEVHDRLSGLAITLYDEQGVSNDDRAKALRWAYRTLAIGLALVTVQAVLGALSSPEEPCEIQRKIQKISRQPLSKGRPKVTKVMTISFTACGRGIQERPRMSSAPPQSIPTGKSGS